MTETARREAAFRSALERLPSAVIIVDEQRRLQPYNRRATELFTCEALRGDLLESRPAHPLSMMIADILSSSDQQPKDCVLTFPSGNRYRIELSRRSEKEGRWLMLLISAANADAVDFDSLGLTPRERDVATRLVAGEPTDEICAALSITRDTLKTHTRRIYEKSGSATRAEFIAKMLRPSSK